MVVLSAAIKAVPDEYLEAARVDGASESQIFWKITMPQLRTTIGVVVTTLIVLVMKVFDIVKVMTNGEFATNVIANEQFDQSFRFNDFGRGAALAVVLFLAVLPIIIFNVRRIRKEAELT
jgi:alpha-glucoside transport system permease protein